jgi:raffinose/stachyose/melibiose transport system permease protein
MTVYTMRTFRSAVSHFVASGVGILALAPLYIIVVNALKTPYDASSMGVGLPLDPQFGNFGTVIDQGKLVSAFANSVIYSVGGTVLAVLTSAMAAYVLSRHRRRSHQFIYLLLIAGIAIPTNFVTLTKVMQITGLIDTQVGIILLYAATQIPFSVFLMYAFINTLPQELDEAAFIDGCGPVRTFVSIILPLLTPVIATCAILDMLNLWNEFLMPLYFLNSTANWPMTLAVYNFFGQFASSWNLVAADVLLTILPMIAIYLIAQRWILSGVSAGSVKG